MTKKENAPVVADESVLLTDEQYSTSDDVDDDDNYHGYGYREELPPDDDTPDERSVLRREFAVLVETYGLPLNRRKFEDAVVDDAVAELEEAGGLTHDQTLSEVAEEALNAVNSRVYIVRQAGARHLRGGNKSMAWLDNLTPRNAARLVVAALPIRSVYAASAIASPKAAGAVCIYTDDGPMAGTYRDVGDADIEGWADEVGHAVDAKWVAQFGDRIKSLAMEPARRLTPTSDPDLVAMADGVLRYSTREVLPFSPSYVFRVKAAANICATEPAKPYWVKHDGSRLYVDELIRQLAAGDPEIELCVYQILGAALRSRVSWDVLPILFNEQGSNGKSTLINLLKALVGNDAWGASDLVTLAGEGKRGRFGLEALENKSLIVCPDSSSGAYIADSLDLKALLTHDAVAIEAKHERPRWAEFYCLVVCAANELPRFRDKTSAMTSRLLLVPFKAKFDRNTATEDTGIRDTFVARQDVLDWIGWKVLFDLEPYSKLSQPSAAATALSAWVEDNDSVVAFWRHCVVPLPSKAEPDEYGMYADAITMATMYAWYCAWLKETRPGASAPTKDAFSKQVYSLVEADDDCGWGILRDADDKPRRVDPKKYCNHRRVDYRNSGCGQTSNYEGLELYAPVVSSRLATRINAYDQQRGRGIVRVYPGGVEPPEPRVYGLTRSGTPERPGRVIEVDDGDVPARKVPERPAPRQAAPATDDDANE